MDIADGLYGFFGTNDLVILLLDALVAIILAISLVYLALELYRIYAEHSRKKAPAQAGKPAAAPPQMAAPKPTIPQQATAPKPTTPPAHAGKPAAAPPQMAAPKPTIPPQTTAPPQMAAPKPTTPPQTTTPQPMEVKKSPAPEAQKPAVEILAIDVIKGSLPDSMTTLVQKYGLGSLTLASQDGLVIVSTAAAPDEDAAIYSGLFQELYKVKQEAYYYIESKEMSLYFVESGAQKVIGVASKKGAFLPEQVKAIREDTKKVVDRFAAGSMKL